MKIRTLVTFGNDTLSGRAPSHNIVLNGKQFGPFPTLHEMVKIANKMGIRFCEMQGISLPVQCCGEYRTEWKGA